MLLAGDGDAADDEEAEAAEDEDEGEDDDDSLPDLLRELPSPFELALDRDDGDAADDEDEEEDDKHPSPSELALDRDDLPPLLQRVQPAIDRGSQITVTFPPAGHAPHDDFDVLDGHHRITALRQFGLTGATTPCPTLPSEEAKHKINVKYKFIYLSWLQPMHSGRGALSLRGVKT
jgi:hypothetical protein